MTWDDTGERPDGYEPVPDAVREDAAARWNAARGDRETGCWGSHASVSQGSRTVLARVRVAESVTWAVYLSGNRIPAGAPPVYWVRVGAGGAWEDFQPAATGWHHYAGHEIQVSVEAQTGPVEVDAWVGLAYCRCG